jgi:hypothetical protein
VLQANVREPRLLLRDALLLICDAKLALSERPSNIGRGASRNDGRYGTGELNEVAAGGYLDTGYVVAPIPASRRRSTDSACCCERALARAVQTTGGGENDPTAR